MANGVDCMKPWALPKAKIVQHVASPFSRCCHSSSLGETFAKLTISFGNYASLRSRASGQNPISMLIPMALPWAKRCSAFSTPALTPRNALQRGGELNPLLIKTPELFFIYSSAPTSTPPVPPRPSSVSLSSVGRVEVMQSLINRGSEVGHMLFLNFNPALPSGRLYRGQRASGFLHPVIS